MINIRVEDISDTKTAVTANFHIEGKSNAVDEFTAVLSALEIADRAIFLVALLNVMDSRIKEENNDEE